MNYHLEFCGAIYICIYFKRMHFFQSTVQTESNFRLEHNGSIAKPVDRFKVLPGPAPQMATLSPSPTPPNSFPCHAVGKMSESRTAWLSSNFSGTLRQLLSAAKWLAGK